jgi:hypothetical protein
MDIALCFRRFRIGSEKWNYKLSAVWRPALIAGIKNATPKSVWGIKSGQVVRDWEDGEK